MPKSHKQVCKDYRERKKTELKEIEKERSNIRRQQSTPEQELKKKELAKLRQRKHRDLQKAQNIIDIPCSSSSQMEEIVYRSSSSEARAVNRVKLALPKSPRKADYVIKQLAIEINIFLPDIPKIKKRIRLSTSVFNHVLELYNREEVSRWTPGMKD